MCSYNSVSSTQNSHIRLYARQGKRSHRNFEIKIPDDNLSKGYKTLTPVLTRDNMMRSFSASVSPPFILIRFLSRHFIAYLLMCSKEH